MMDLFGHPRPALRQLVGAMTKLPRRQRREIAKFGRKARAAKSAHLRQLASEAEAEARRLHAEMMA